jgi:hypothetical protein
LLELVPPTLVAKIDTGYNPGDANAEPETTPVLEFIVRPCGKPTALKLDIAPPKNVGLNEKGRPCEQLKAAELVITGAANTPF